MISVSRDIDKPYRVELEMKGLSHSIDPDLQKVYLGLTHKVLFISQIKVHVHRWYNAK